MKSTIQSHDRTSYHGIRIKATVDTLRQICGAPRCSDNDGQDKVNFEWVMETEAGLVFTIYDYKEYRRLSEDEIISWHIGSKSVITDEQAKAELEEAIAYKAMTELNDSLSEHS